MAYDFPNSPTNGQQYTPAGGQTYTYDSAGGKWTVTGTGLSGLPTASQDDQENGVSSSAAVTPAVQQYHRSAAKAWCSFNVAGTMGSNYNVSSVTDNGTGDWLVNINTDFSSVNWTGLAFGGLKIAAPATTLVYNCYTQVGGSFQIRCAKDFAGTAGEPDQIPLIYFVGYGDL